MPAPAPSVASFLADYPEFDDADTSLIAAKLAEASHYVNPKVFQDDLKVEYMVKLEAALLLMRSPFGRKMRLEATEQFLVWERELHRRKRTAVIGLRVF